METYTKLAGTIITSSVWLEDDHTRLTWVTLMALADRWGEVHASVPGLAHMARVPVESCRTALVKFMSPDPDSRTTDEAGIRLLPIDGGWVLVNHEKYRRLASHEDRLAKAAARQRLRRSSVTKRDIANKALRSVTKRDTANLGVTCHTRFAIQKQIQIQKQNKGTGTSTVVPGLYESPSRDEGGAIAPTEPPPKPKFFPATEQDAVAHAAFAGCPEDFASLTYNKAVGRGFADAKGIIIRSFRHYLKTEWTYQQNRSAEQATKQTNHKPFPSEIKAVIAAKQAILDQIKARGHEDAFGFSPRPADKADFKTLKKEIARLNQQLSQALDPP